jgi:hypothetical protein
MLNECGDEYPEIQVLSSGDIHFATCDRPEGHEDPEHGYGHYVWSRRPKDECDQCHRLAGYGDTVCENHGHEIPGWLALSRARNR